MAEVDRIKGTLPPPATGSQKALKPAAKPAAGKPTAANSNVWLQLQFTQAKFCGECGKPMVKTQKTDLKFPPSGKGLQFAGAAHAAIDGTVINGTTGQPQPNATVAQSRQRTRVVRRQVGT